MVKINEAVSVVGLGKNKESVVTGVEMFQKTT